MAVPSSIADLSTTAGSNSPSGSEAIGTSLDDYLRAIQSIIKQENARGSDIASASSITIPNAGKYFVVTGVTSITSIADSWNGRCVVLEFSGALTLTNSVSLVLPGGANITTAAGDAAIFCNETTGLWRCVGYSYASGIVSTTGNNTWTGTQTFRDNKFSVTDNSDTTKVLAFEVSGVTTGTTRTLTVPNYSGIPAVPANEGTSGYVLTSAGAGSQPTWVATSSGGGCVGMFSNLQVSATGASANVSASADEVVLKNASNAYYTARSVSLTINTATTGANGLDTGTLATSTWYSVWVIYDGSTVAGLISTSATAPTLPGSYTYKARIGWIKTDSTGNKYPLGFTQKGSRVQYLVAYGTNITSQVLVANSVAAVGSITTPTYVGVSVSSFVPSTAARIFGCMASASSIVAMIAPNGTGYGSYTSTTNPPVVLFNPGGMQYSFQYDLILETSSIYWATNGAGAVITCLGWEDNL